MKGNLDNISKNISNSGPNNNNPKFNGKPNFTLGVSKQKKRIKREVYDALNFRSNEFNNNV